MCYDMNSIRRTTEKGIPDLADKIFAGIVNEEEAINALFMGLRPKLTKELEKRKADEDLWIAASESKELKKLKDYVETYDNEAPEYIGRHIDEANNLISLIENDDAEWYDARSKNSISAYRHYLDIYDNPAPSYRGKYIDQVNEAIKVVKDRDDWAKAKESDSIRSYSEYLSMYDKEAPAYIGGFVNEAKKAILSLEDDAAWQLATNLNTVESYKDYLGKYDVVAPAYCGKYVESAKQKIEELLPPSPPSPPDPRIADDEAWNKARLANTKHSYEEYLAKYRKIGGLHIREAENAILKLQSDEDWENACAENTLSAYKRFVGKYEPMSNKYMSMHLPKAKKKIEELTPKTDPKPIKWKKWIIILTILDVAAFLIHQHKCHQWPFEEIIVPPITIVEDVDSLQWAIDNKDIPLLTKYAEMDSTRAYYPLALALNAQDSVANVEKTLHWLDIILDPDVNSLHQNIINDIQQKELDELVSRFNAINPNEKDADRRYLAVYKDYIQHFERLATHTPRIRVRYMPIEDMANAQIADRKKHEEIRTSILREWETQQSRLRTILSNIDDNAKKAYSNNQ